MGDSFWKCWKCPINKEAHEGIAAATPATTTAEIPEDIEALGAAATTTPAGTVGAAATTTLATAPTSKTVETATFSGKDAAAATQVKVSTVTQQQMQKVAKTIIKRKQLAPSVSMNKFIFTFLHDALSLPASSSSPCALVTG